MGPLKPGTRVRTIDLPGLAGRPGTIIEPPEGSETLPGPNWYFVRFDGDGRIRRVRRDRFDVAEWP